MEGLISFFICREFFRLYGKRALELLAEDFSHLTSSDSYVGLKKKKKRNAVFL